MNLDELARQATTDVVDRVTPTTGVRLADLKLSRSRRRVLSTLTATVAAVVAVAIGLQVLSPSDRDLAPTPPDGDGANGALLVLDDAALRVASGEVAHLPEDVKRFSMLDFTPDGREVVYQNRDGLLVAMDVSSGEQRTLFDCGEDPCLADVSPDGDRLAIDAGEGLQVIDLTTGEATVLVEEGGFDPQWSPDGGDILYSGSDRDLYRIPARGGAAPTRLVETEKYDYVHAARWSPDGRTIAYFVVDVHEQQFIGDYTATLLPADGSGEPRSLFMAVRNCCGGWTPPTVAWAPDGSRVLFGTNRHPTRAYTSEGEGIEEPAVLPPLLGSAAWQPLSQPTDVD